MSKPTPKAEPVAPLIEVVPHESGEPQDVDVRFHPHDGQWRALDSRKRIVAVISGVRSGKTSIGPVWLKREMENCGPGDYLVGAPSFPLLDKGARPEIANLFGRIFNLGKDSARHFTISRDGHDALWPDYPYERPSRIIYGHADNPESLAAMRARAAWLDEAGQKRFRLPSFEEVQRRVSFDRGRILITTTVYNLGWLKQRIYDPWLEAKRAGIEHGEIDVINFRSIDNPAFPKEEYYEARRTLPLWKFLMFFDGIFTRPAGLIYDRFDPKRHVLPRFAIPADWPRFGGVDFGAVNTAAVFVAQELDPTHRTPTGRFIAYREYHPGKLPPETHAVNLLKGDADRGIPPEREMPRFVGGSRSEDDWRDRFGAVGVPVDEPPVKDVEVQIDALWELIANDRFLVMDDMVGLIDELSSYSRVLDDNGEPTEKIDEDQLYHLLAACRYLACWLKDAGLFGWQPTQGEQSLTSRLPEGVFHVEDVQREDRRSRNDENGISSGGFDNSGFPDW